ncbi:hypothetical protein SLNSH_10530 [Alsobacter soli]|uniref:Magnesium transporter MgtE intracellular domain-containing protein n=1 Tax=Alsobacter soli TaxID=2109933 RepID=A0A2T1HUB1_9HYPH|nr:hypothetical protein SLNSH_10530 [Alsobacter soli]
MPAVAGAAGCLLLLKAVEISSPETAPRSQLAQYAAEAIRARLDPETTGSTVPAKKKEEKTDKVDPPAAPQAGLVNLDQPQPSPAEKSLLQHLGERREQLDERQRELDTRENLLKAADKKLEARINELRELEGAKGGAPGAGSAPGAAGGPGAAADPALKNIVTMYEAMKPKDAAKVFDRLDLKVLVPVVNAMNPRKMSEILAAMSTEAAERLTVELAKGSIRQAVAPAPSNASLPAGELPAIDPRKP